MNYSYFLLTCSGEEEANIVADKLLEKRLIACAKTHEVNSSFLWQGKVDKSNEIMLTMESAEELFEEVEHEVKKLHSYETFVLTCVPMSKVSVEATNWLKNSLKDSSTQAP